MMTEKRLGKTVQEKILKQTGLFVVKAGPGSGKTLTVAKRLATKMSDWNYSRRGIATISFTNVAWQEIRKYLSEKLGLDQPINYPHFLGTIDSFINQYIFLPFGHLVMGCNKRPTLVGEPYGSWFGKNLGSQFDNFSFNSSGKLFILRPKRFKKGWEQDLRGCIGRMKKRINRAGYATQLDANYFAMRVMEEYPQIAKALSYRFPMLMIDEAQDTSEMQMRAVDLLIENGLEEVMLIGDPDQAIFEWRTAKPELFLSKYKEWENNSIDLNDNYRSSQKICDFFSKISSFENTPRALNNKCKDFGFIPQIRAYGEGNYDELIEDFLELCKSQDIVLSPENVAIVARSKNLLQEIRGIEGQNRTSGPWNDINSKNIAKSTYLFDNGNYKDAFHILEKAVCEIRRKNGFCSKEELQSVIGQFGFAQWRRGIYKLMNLLPKTHSQLGEWKANANEILKENESIITNFQLKTKRDGKQSKYSKMSFDELFAASEARKDQDEYTIGTVHSVKGETFEAVLLFVKKKGGNRQGYASILESKIEENEELRTIYVAITRPRKVLVLAVPQEDVGVWKRKFLYGEC